MTGKHQTHSPPLAGLRILVVEDDYFIADELCRTLRDNGAEVVGPSPDIERGMELIGSERIDCAVLDINLQGTLAFDLAFELRNRGTPTIFATGYDGAILPDSLQDTARLEKPVHATALLQAVLSACGRPRYGSDAPSSG